MKSFFKIPEILEQKLLIFINLPLFKKIHYLIHNLVANTNIRFGNKNNLTRPNYDDFQERVTNFKLIKFLRVRRMDYRSKIFVDQIMDGRNFVIDGLSRWTLLRL